MDTVSNTQMKLQFGQALMSLDVSAPLLQNGYETWHISPTWQWEQREMLQTTNNKPFGIQTKITLLGIELILEQHSLFL